MKKRCLTDRLLLCLCSLFFYVVVAFILSEVIHSQSRQPAATRIKNRHDAYVERITDVNVSSATVELRWAGEDTDDAQSYIDLTSLDRVALITNPEENSLNIFFGFEPEISTGVFKGVTQSSNCTIGLSPGASYPTTFRGRIYFLNEGLSVSSSPVLTLKEFEILAP